MQSIQIYDTTLRDGTQGEGVSLSLQDKLQITQRLARSASTTSKAAIRSPTRRTRVLPSVRELDLKHAKICAFGMTRRNGMAAPTIPA